MTDQQRTALRLIAWDRNLSEAERMRILADAFRPEPITHVSMSTRGEAIFLIIMAGLAVLAPLLAVVWTMLFGSDLPGDLQ